MLESGLGSAREVLRSSSESSGSRSGSFVSTGGSFVGEPQRESRIFPCRLLCCPSCFPDSWRSIKDWLHLVLLIGLITSVVFVISEAVLIFSDMNCASPLCVRQWISLILVLPSVYEFFKFVNGHDKSLRESKQLVEDSVKGLRVTYEQTNIQLKNLAKEFAETAQFYVHSHFSGSYDNFSEFFQRVLEFRKDLYNEEELLYELRCFTVHWLKTFQQTLLRPPDWLNTETLTVELQNCRTIDELCNKIQQFLDKIPCTSRLMSVPETLALEDLAVPMHGHEIMVLRCHCRPRTCRCGRQNTDSSGFPVTMGLGCLSFTILSIRHLRNFSYLLIDLMLLCLELWEMEWPTLGLVGVNLICVVSMLICFGQIDEITQLQTQAHFYEQECQRIKEQAERSKDDWDKVACRHKLWKNRTVPSLVILERVVKQLDNKSRRLAQPGGNSEKDDRHTMLRDFNQVWNEVNKRLSNADDWVSETSLPPNFRESIGDQLNIAGTVKDVKELVNRLESVANDRPAIAAP